MYTPFRRDIHQVKLYTQWLTKKSIQNFQLQTSAWFNKNDETLSWYVSAYKFLFAVKADILTCIDMGTALALKLSPKSLK